MPDFMFAYHGGKAPESPEEGQKVMAEWMAWFEGLGDKVKNPGNPVGMSKTVFADKVDDNGGSNPLSGFSIISAGSIEEACDIAKNCPMVKDGSGTAEIAEIMEM